MVADFSYAMFLAYITKNTTLRNIHSYPEVGDSKFPNNFRSIFADREFENLLQERLISTKGILIGYDSTEVQIQEILQLTSTSLKN